MRTLLRRAHQELFQLSVRVGVGGEAQALAGVDDLESAKGHAAAKLAGRLPEDDGLTQRAEAVAEIGHGLLVEVVIQIRRQQAAVDLSLLQATVYLQCLPLYLSLVLVAGHHAHNQLRNLAGSAGHVVGEHGNGNPVIDEHRVRRDKAGFLSDLARSVKADATFDFVAVSSYGMGTRTSGAVKLIKDLDEPIEGKNVLVVEDILDTGLTLSYLRKLLQQQRPKTLRIATLLDKPSRRLEKIEADYVGFSIPNLFVIGYGMDYAERYRNLPDICLMSPDHPE